MTKHQLTPMIDRILARIQLIPTGCWEWTGAKALGYGVIGRGRRNDGTVQVHRALWEWLCGPVPSGMQLDHLCRNRACCNPNHLEVVTQRENILRGDSTAAQHARKTHCIHGHLFDETNTYFDRRGRRTCRTCRRLNMARYKIARFQTITSKTVIGDAIQPERGAA